MKLDLPDGLLPEAVTAGVGGFAPAEASRALAAVRLLAGLGTGWTGSGLTGDGFPFELAFTTQQLAQVFAAGDEAHGDEEAPLELAGREHRNDVRVVEEGGGAGLGHEALAEVGVVLTKLLR